MKTKTTTATPAKPQHDAEQFERVKKSRISVLLDDVFFGSVLMQVKCIEDHTIPTWCTNGVTIRYNPAFTKTLTQPEINYVNVHELGHIIYLHSWRRMWRDARIWNMACDHVINLKLNEWANKQQKPGTVRIYEMPKGGLADTRFNGMCEEEVYNILLKEAKDGGGLGGDGSDGLNQDPGGCGGVEDAPGNSAERAESLEQTKQYIENAIATAKAMGKDPGNFAREISELVQPQVNWKEKLRVFVTELLKNDYTWQRPRPVWLSYDIILPTLYGEGFGGIGIGNDTSGSVGQAEQNAFFAEVRDIFEELKPSKLTVLHCDADVAGVETFQPGDVLKINPVGGGGTDFEPVFRYIDEHDLNPVCVVYLTDLQGSFPATPPPYPVLWVSTMDGEAPFGEVVRINV